MCLANGKNYIGITSDLAHRLVVHFNDKANKKRQTLLSRAIRKYGKDNFQVFMLEEVDTWKIACQRECHYIHLYDTYKINGYNMTFGGDGQYGLIHTEETRAKMSASHIGKGCGTDNPMYGKIGPMRGRKWSKESREKLSISCKGRTPWNKGKKCPQLSGENNGFYGKEHSEDSKKKMSRLGMKHSDETKRKFSLARKGKANNTIYTPEIRLRMSESAKLREPNTKGLKWSEESKQRASIARKLAWASGVYKNRSPKNNFIRR